MHPTQELLKDIQKTSGLFSGITPCGNTSHTPAAEVDTRSVSELKCGWLIITDKEREEKFNHFPV